MMPPRRDKKAKVPRHKPAEGALLPADVPSPPVEGVSPQVQVPSPPADIATSSALAIMPFGLSPAAAALRIACNELNYALIARLLEDGADPNETGAGAATILHIACKNRVIGIVSVLIEGGAALDTLDRDGNTALYYSCRQGDPEIIKLLLKKGADPFKGRSRSLCQGSRCSSTTHFSCDLLVVTHLTKENRCAFCGTLCSLITHHSQTTK
jgi:hypothetical protein